MRRQARRGNGRFTRNTPENTLGLHIAIHERKANGEWCGAFNPSPVGEPKPETCHACGELLQAPAEVPPEDDEAPARPRRLTREERHQAAADAGYDTWDEYRDYNG